MQGRAKKSASNKSFSMVRGKEISLEDIVAIQTLRKEGHSFGKIAKEVGCRKSGAYKAFKTYEQTGNFVKWV